MKDSYETVGHAPDGVRCWDGWGEWLDARPGEDHGCWWHVHPDPRTTRASGVVTATPVRLVEDPDGQHHGWIEAGKQGARGPIMVQPHPSLFRMQFPGDPQLAEAAGSGSVVRLRVERRPGPTDPASA